MTTYYVSSEIGSNNNAGTSANAPLASLQAAENLVKPGDTVEVMNGAYTGPYYGNVLTISTSGAANAPITFEAAPGATPVIDSSGTWQGIEIDASYITIKGFTIVGDAANYNLTSAMAGYGTGNPDLDGNGIAATSGKLIHNITIENDTVYNEPGAGIAVNNGDYIQILNNNVHDNAHWSAYGASGIEIGSSYNFDSSPGPHSIISGNTSINNSELVPEYRADAITDGEGIILDTNPVYTGSFLIEDNTTSGNSGPGIETFLSDNAVITGNTTTGDLTNPGLVGEGEIFINQSNNNTATNNITTVGANDAAPTVKITSAGGTVSSALQEVSGTVDVADAGSEVTVLEGTTPIGTGTADANGNWSANVTLLNQGANVLTATDTNISGAGTSGAVTDTLSPNAELTNGSFETGSFSGWTLGGNLLWQGVSRVNIDSNAESGAYAAGLGSIGADGTLSQTIATMAGKTYVLSFWLQSEASGGNDFKAIWNGQTLLSLTNAAQFGYKQYSYVVTATSSATTLEFSAANLPSRWDLDNVSMTPVSDSFLVQNGSGQASVWEMDGSTRAGGGALSVSPGPAWHAVGTSDFTVDGDSDILWQNTSTSQVSVWEMNGATRIGGGAVSPNPGPSWTAVGTGDFYGDGDSDILWQNTSTGQVSIWEMDGNSRIGGGAVSPNPGSSWKAVGTGDFYGNGDSDILWQNRSTGQVSIWEMDGNSRIGGGAVSPNPGPAWQAIGTGDFYGNGLSDILFQNTSTGQVSIWEMDGNSRIGGGAVANIPGPSWHAIGTGGGSDILFQNTSTGEISIWEMDGNSRIAGGAVSPNPGPSWRAVGLS